MSTMTLDQKGERLRGALTLLGLHAAVQPTFLLCACLWGLAELQGSPGGGFFDYKNAPYDHAVMTCIAAASLIGLTQLIYAVPAYIIMKRQGRLVRGHGILLALSTTLLMNGLAFVFFGEWQ